MPAQDRVGSEKSPDLGQEHAAEDFPFDGQAAAFVVFQQDAAFAEFLPRHLVLGPKVFNDLLMLVDPARKDEMEQMPGLKNETHGGHGAEAKMA